MGPGFVLVEVGVTTTEAGARVERMRQYRSWAVEWVSVTVAPTYESDLDIRSTGGFRKRQC